MSLLLGASLNGTVCSETTGVSPTDRSLHYGDGVFETMLVQRGEVVAFDLHYSRLQAGCERLDLEAPKHSDLLRDIAALVGDHQTAILKLVVSRAGGGRGYRGLPSADSNRLLILFAHTGQTGPSPAIVRWCATRLARNSALAGIKHLNRLEQVLAQREWWDDAVDEGLMLDTEGELISATASNLFLVENGVLRTPDLRYCGVRGTMRARVLNAARQQGIEVEEGALRPEELFTASEVFISNAIRGVRPVTVLADRAWQIGPCTRRIAATLDLW